MYWNILKYWDLCQWKKKTFLSSPRQQENPWLSVETVSEKQNRDMNLRLELPETIMSAIFLPILTKDKEKKYITHMA